MKTTTPTTDDRLLIDYFYVPKAPARHTRQKYRKKTNGPTVTEPEPTIEPRKKRYRLEKVAGGFRLCTGDPDADVPKLIEIRAAYDVRRGNALKKYDPADFDLAGAEFRLEPPPHGIDIVERGANRMLVKVLEKDFQLSVTGFDTKRDVLVNINLKEAEDAA